MEIVFIVISPIIVGYNNVSSLADGGKSRSIASLFSGALIQYILEMVDFTNVTYLTVYAKVPFLEYASLHHRHYIWAMTSICFFSAALSMSYSFIPVLYRIAPTNTSSLHESLWVYASTCVLDSNSTFNACL
jgi:hypothetical protein